MQQKYELILSEQKKLAQRIQRLDGYLNTIKQNSLKSVAEMIPFDELMKTLSCEEYPQLDETLLENVRVMYEQFERRKASWIVWFGLFDIDFKEQSEQNNQIIQLVDGTIKDYDERFIDLKADERMKTVTFYFGDDPYVMGGQFGRLLNERATTCWFYDLCETWLAYVLGCLGYKTAVQSRLEYFSHLRDAFVSQPVDGYYHQSSTSHIDNQLQRGFELLSAPTDLPIRNELTKFSQICTRELFNSDKNQQVNSPRF
jgi:hypothetical protein